LASEEAYEKARKDTKIKKTHHEYFLRQKNIGRPKTAASIAFILQNTSTYTKYGDKSKFKYVTNEAYFLRSKKAALLIPSVSFLLDLAQPQNSGAQGQDPDRHPDQDHPHPAASSDQRSLQEN